MRQEALKKIKKLKRLAESSNPHEAKLAEQMAAMLMKKHGISEAEVNVSDDNGFYHVPIRKCFKLNLEEHFILSLLERYFHVMAFFHKVGVQSLLSLIGRFDHVDIARDAYQVLRFELKTAWTAYCVSMPAKKNAKKSFYMGYTQGVRTVLEKQDRTFRNPHAVLILDDELREYAEREFVKGDPIEASRGDHSEQPDSKSEAKLEQKNVDEENEIPRPTDMTDDRAILAGYNLGLQTQVRLTKKETQKDRQQTAVGHS